VNVTDADNKRATSVEGEYVLQSGDDGPIEILFAPTGTGEKTCVVRFGGVIGRLAVILDADLPAATHSLTGATSCLATVCGGTSTAGALGEGRQVTVWNHSEKANHKADTFGYADPVAGELHFTGDCDPMAAR